MRYLTDHLTNVNVGEPFLPGLQITVADEPGAGGACHEYLIQNPEGEGFWKVSFQKGPIGESGSNGVTHEALLAILIDRMRCFQQGPFACDANRYALDHMEAALRWLHHRTRDRVQRGVEGTNET